MSTPSITASPRVHQLLARLHAQARAEDSFVSTYAPNLAWYLRHYVYGESWTALRDAHTRDRSVALDADKCAFVYLLARSSGARRVVEAGTSFGVSTVYLALAVGHNVEAARRRGRRGDGEGGEVEGRVVATEWEPEKAARAREHWREAGEEVEPWIELREGDLRETLKGELCGTRDEVDMLLLDIWTPLALPTLKLVQPRLRSGALVVADNIDSAKSGYQEFLQYINDPQNGFRTLTVPFSGGLEVSVYLPWN